MHRTAIRAEYIQRRKTVPVCHDKKKKKSLSWFLALWMLALLPLNGALAAGPTAELLSFLLSVTMVFFSFRKTFSFYRINMY